MQNCTYFLSLEVFLTTSSLKINQFTEEIPLTTSTKTTPSTTTSLERVEIDIIQKNNGYHSKSKGMLMTFTKVLMFR